MRHSKARSLEIAGAALAVMALFSIFWIGHRAPAPADTPIGDHYGPLVPAKEPVERARIERSSTEISYGSAKIVSASSALFAYAHGTAEAAGKFFIGMADRAGNKYLTDQVIVFDAPAYLRRYEVIQLPRHGDVETMAYDAASRRIYLALTEEPGLQLYAIDTKTYAVSLVASSSAYDLGRKPAIAADDRYVYGITDTVPSRVFRADPATGEVAWSSKGHISHGHSAAIGVGQGGKEQVFFGGGMTDGFEAVDAETLALSGKLDLGPCGMSDDSPYDPVADGTDGYIYIGCEQQPYGYRVRASDLSVTSFPLPGESLGMFILGGDLYNAAQDSAIDIYPRARLDKLERYRIDVSGIADKLGLNGQSLEPNEIFQDPHSGSILFTAWWGVPGLFQLATSSAI